MLRLTVDEGVAVGYGVDGAEAAPGRIEDSTLTYAEVRAGSDVEFVAGSDSVKETLVLKDRDAPTEWRFPLALDGLTASLDEQATSSIPMPPGRSGRGRGRLDGGLELRRGLR